MSAATLHAKRLRAEKRFRWYGRAALGLALAMLALLLLTLAMRGLPGFVRTELRLAVPLPAIMAQEAEALPFSAYGALAREALALRFPDAKEPDERRELNALLAASGAGDMLRAYALSHPDALGKTVTLWLPAGAPLDRAFKRGTAEGVLTPVQARWAVTLSDAGDLRATFNTVFFTGGDSRQPEQAGFLGAMAGSLLTIAVCMALAFPLGVMTAVYLQEFARKGWLSDIIEVNINNLAAVPSIVFGLLGLAVYLNWFGMPRSSPLAGGMTLALMVLPVIIIATRTALSAVPDSIRHAALALGASPLQAVWHHTLPLALPGIMTGTILGIARALGETAPLLMIGMVAFIADVPRGFTDPATAMPVQVYLWAGSPEAGFVEKTAAGILVLLVALLLMNALAIYIRRRFEIRW